MSPKKLIPTVEIINNGPELLVKAINLSHSISEQIPSFLKSETILAPVGYPLIIPIIRAKEAAPGTLKIGLIIGLNSLPKILIISVYFNNSTAIKNGNKEGRTEVDHSSNPDFVAVRFVFENIIRQIVKTQKIKGIITFFIFIMKNFIKYHQLIL